MSRGAGLRSAPSRVYAAIAMMPVPHSTVRLAVLRSIAAAIAIPR
jgi:hypothetical protein